MKSQTRAAFTLVEIMIVVAIIGMLAAIAIPNLSQAIKTARQRTCAINRKNIDAAKLRWALETQQPENATPTEEDLFGTKQYIEHKPDCPASGKYTLNAVEEKCTCSAADHVNLAVNKVE
ncbi:MAG: prepilin-type N-terminal cleavage/methylation domain-containing protein [Verrucomicrobiota bacterium]